MSTEKYTCIYNIQIDFKAVFLKKLHSGVGRKKPTKKPRYDLYRHGQISFAEID